MERYARVFFFPLFLFLCCFSSFFVYGLAANSFQLIQNQREIMTNLSMNLPTSQTIGVWNTTTDTCRWVGVTCSPAPSSVVTNLSLSGFRLSTTNSSLVARFFDLLCRLDHLKSLDLSRNSLTTIPGSFFSNCSGLSGLESLNLSYNGLTGPLPSFSGFGALQSLDLSFNSFHGAVNSGLEKLTRLKILYLFGNFFNSTIPAPVGGATAPSLEVLVLSVNRFHGEIPTRIFDYKNLTLLDLSQNMLTGSIPVGIAGLSKLEVLLLSSNYLSGRIPSSLAMIKTLYRFAANQNNFTGSIPRNITTHASVVALSYNNLTGEIPSDLLSPRNLEFVDLSSNHLQGPIPRNLSQSLYRLRLGNNNLSGSIPSTIGKLSNLTYLELNGNVLGGEIPSGLGNCTKLMLLDLSSNQLQGNLTKELGYLEQLVVLELQNNNLTGEIPDELLKFRYLSTLDLSQNLLAGEIPQAISNLKELSVLNLQSNSFYGSIPDSISSFENLMELQLGNNNLSGTVPRMPMSLRIALNLGSNFFNGHIPSYLGDLSQLEILDLSNNKFSGEVPTSLTTIQSLIELDLSDNLLSGVLPKFPSFVRVITTGNKDLIISNSSSHTNTSSNPIRTKGKRNILLVIMVIIGAVIGMGLTAAVLLLIISKRFDRVKDEGPQAEENLPQVISGCFITVNNIHRSSIDFTKTMEVVSNPANIIMKSRFSTYYKAVMPNGVSCSVKKLNWTDKIFQMGSHERFGQELEVLGKLSNSNVMVPLAYVLTEDSAYLFYEHVHKGTVFDFLHKDSENALDWPSRYSIALGVAQGLTFLHGCDQPVLLLDLSTKSVRLKSVKEPQIGDIELCKVIDPSKSTGSLSMVAGSVGYVPPEYAYTMRITMAGNVYSFGVILLELLTGKPPVSQGTELAKWALSYSTRPEEREKILDSRVSKASLAVQSQMLSVLKVALACVSISPEARPKMRNVLRMLFNAR